MRTRAAMVRAPADGQYSHQISMCGGHWHGEISSSERSTPGLLPYYYAEHHRPWLRLQKS